MCSRPRNKIYTFGLVAYMVGRREDTRCIAICNLHDSIGYILRSMFGLSIIIQVQFSVYAGCASSFTSLLCIPIFVGDLLCVPLVTTASYVEIALGAPSILWMNTVFEFSSSVQFAVP
jgi:hypothetical protein